MEIGDNVRMCEGVGFKNGIILDISRYRKKKQYDYVVSNRDTHSIRCSDGEIIQWVTDSCFKKLSDIRRGIIEEILN